MIRIRSAALLALSVTLCADLGRAHAQNSVNVNLQNLQPVRIADLQLNVLRLNTAQFQQAIQAPNVLQLNLNDLPARIQARDVAVTRGIGLAGRLAAGADLRADIGRAVLTLPRGLTVPAQVQLRDGARQEVLLFGQDTVALSVAQAEEDSARNRGELLRSFGISEQAPLPADLQPRGQAAPGSAAAPTATGLTAKIGTQIDPNVLLRPPLIRNVLPTPSQPGQEQGDGGSAAPRDGACRFTPTNALFGQLRGSNIGLITTIKNQGARGTCMAFAYTSALESLIARRRGTRMNLSEQYAYYWLRGDDGVLGDGAGWGDFSDAISRARMIPYETAWRYNPSPNRVRLPADTSKPITEFRNSCLNYPDQACSDTTAQAQLVCQGGTNNCAWKPEYAAGGGVNSFRPTRGNEVWASLGGMPFTDVNVTRAYRRNMMRSMLDRGDQLILGFTVDPAFDSIGANGQPNLSLMGGRARGGHAVHIVGYVNTGTRTFNNVQYRVGPGTVNFGTLSFPTGVWVIKNSWSCGFGDGGYAYLPDAFLDQETWGVFNLPAGAVASDMPGF